MKYYHKIPALFKRDETTKKVKMFEYRDKEVEYLKNNQWIFTEKIDGTNICVAWDGHEVSFRGRTSRAEIPSKLLEFLQKTFTEEIMEQVFFENEVTLYGEGYGGKIQCGGNYSPSESFILFDIYMGGSYVKRSMCNELAQSLGTKSVPTLFTGKIEEAVRFVQDNDLIEGLVGAPETCLRNQFGERIIIKIKNNDVKPNDSRKKI